MALGSEKGKEMADLTVSPLWQQPPQFANANENPPLVAEDAYQLFEKTHPELASAINNAQLDPQGQLSQELSQEIKSRIESAINTAKAGIKAGKNVPPCNNFIVCVHGENPRETAIVRVQEHYDELKEAVEYLSKQNSALLEPYSKDLKELKRNVHNFRRTSRDYADFRHITGSLRTISPPNLFSHLGNWFIDFMHALSIN